MNYIKSDEITKNLVENKIIENQNSISNNKEENLVMLEHRDRDSVHVRTGDRYEKPAENEAPVTQANPDATKSYSHHHHKIEENRPINDPSYNNNNNRNDDRMGRHRDRDVVDEGARIPIQPITPHSDRNDNSDMGTTGTHPAHPVHPGSSNYPDHSYENSHGHIHNNPDVDTRGDTRLHKHMSGHEHHKNKKREHEYYKHHRGKQPRPDFHGHQAEVHYLENTQPENNANHEAENIQLSHHKGGHRESEPISTQEAQSIQLSHHKGGHDDKDSQPLKTHKETEREVTTIKTHHEETSVVGQGLERGHVHRAQGHGVGHHHGVQGHEHGAQGHGVGHHHGVQGHEHGAQGHQHGAQGHGVGHHHGAQGHKNTRHTQPVHHERNKFEDWNDEEYHRRDNEYHNYIGSVHTRHNPTDPTMNGPSDNPLSSRTELKNSENYSINDINKKDKLEIVQEASLTIPAMIPDSEKLQLSSDAKQNNLKLDKVEKVEKEISNGNMRILIYLFITIFLISFCLVVNDYHKTLNNHRNFNHGDYELFDYQADPKREDYLIPERSTLRDI
jgi:hypothetical protein